MTIETYLQTLSKETQKELTVEKAKNYYYHISTNPKIKKFIPRICDRSQEGEDRSIPRICVAENLMDCMFGYIDVFSNLLKTCEEDGDYFGGWKIYGFDTPYAIKPSKALLPDVDKTGERWLVNYDSKTAEYDPMEAGVLFVKELRLIPNKGTLPKGSILFYLNCYLDSGIKLDKGFGDPDSEGLYSFEIPLDRFVLNDEDSLPETVDGKKNIFNFKRIDQKEFSTAKRKQTMAALANFQEKPTFVKWAQ